MFLLLAGVAVQLIHRIGRHLVTADLLAAVHTPSDVGSVPKPLSYGSTMAFA